MSQIPDDQGRSLPEADQPKFPSKARVTQAQPAEESDSAIDLSGEAGDGVSLSGVSVIEWASLVEDAPPPVPDPSPEAGLASPVVDPPLPLLAPDAHSDDIFDAVIDLDSAPVFPSGFTEDSVVELGEEPGGAEKMPSSANVIDFKPDEPAVDDIPSTGDVLDMEADAVIVEESLVVEDAIDLGAEGAGVEESPASSEVIDLIGSFQLDESSHSDGSLARGASSTPLHEASTEPESDAIDLGEDAIIVEDVPVSSEVIDLGEDAVVDAAPSGVDLSEVVVVEEAESPVAEARDESEIDLFGAGFIEGPASMASSRVVDSGVDLVPEDIVSDTPSKSKLPGMDSSRDLIAEGLESGVGLASSKGDGSGAMRSGDSSDDALDDFLAQVDNQDPSSSVDLGSMHSIPTIDLNDLASSSATPEPSPIDLGADISGEVAAAGPASHIEATSFDAAEDSIDLMGLEAAEVEEEVAPVSKKKTEAKTGKTGLVDLEPEPEAEVEEAPKPAAKKKGKKTADDEEETPKKKPKPEKKPSKAGAWLGGTVLGAVLGATACVGAWTLGIDPPQGLRDMAGVTTPKPAPVPGGATRPMPVEPPVAEVAADRLRKGEIDKITEADLTKLNDTNPAELSLRAEARWLRYLKEKRGKGLKADAEPVKQALADLDKAVASGSADALFQRGQIYEMVGDVAKARADFEKGLKEAKDAAGKERFQAGLDGLPAKVAMGAGLPAGHGLIALLAMGFQPPPPPKADPPTPLEAAPKLAQAIKLASEKKYKEAIEAVEEARKRHDARRFLFPNQPQNPRSDPREKSFLSACDEIAKRYKLLMTLSDPGYLTAKERAPLVDAIVAKAEETARAALLKETAQKLVGDKPAASVEDLAKLIDAERKTAAGKVKDLEGVVADNKKAIEGLETKLKDTTALLDTAKKDLLAAGAREKALAATNASYLAALQAVGDVVKVKVKDATAGPALVTEVRETLRIARMKDPAGAIRKLEGEVARDREKLANRWEPAQMLAAWLPIVANDRGRADLAARAMKDVARVESDPKATPEQKAQASAIAGLVYRNQEKYPEAKTALAKATDLAEPWKTFTADATRDVNEPAAVAAEKAESLAAAGKTKEALAMFTRALSVPGGDKGVLHARRGLTGLEAARARGPVGIDDAAFVSAKKDADAAVKAGAPEGHYLAGRLAEQAGDLLAAEKAYRAALEGHKDLDEAGTRYRAALARVLIRIGAGGAKAPRPLPSTTKLDRPSPGQLLVAALFAIALPGEKADVTEAERLAREILALGDKAPFTARAQALAVQGLHTQALQTYLDGLLAKGLLSPTHANALRTLIETHPTLSRPEGKSTPDPILAEKYYGKGLNHFFGKRYAAAEEAFKDAVKNDNADARYYYFLGLSRLALGDRAAYEDFDQGAKLERSGRPDKAAVARSLERVQGKMRRAINNVREGATRDRAR